MYVSNCRLFTVRYHDGAWPEPQQKIEVETRPTIQFIAAIMMQQAETLLLPKEKRASLSPTRLKQLLLHAPFQQHYFLRRIWSPCHRTFPAQYAVSEAAILPELKHTNVTILQG